MEMTAVNDIAFKPQIGELRIQTAVKICGNLESENQVLFPCV